MGNAPDLDWGKLFKAVWRYVLLLVGAWLALRYCSYHDSVMGMFFVACVVVIICTAMIIHRLNRLVSGGLHQIQADAVLDLLRLFFNRFRSNCVSKL